MYHDTKITDTSLTEYTVANKNYIECIDQYGYEILKKLSHKYSILLNNLAPQSFPTSDISRSSVALLEAAMK